MKRLSKYIFGICMILLFLSCRSQKPITEVIEPAEVVKDGSGQEAIFSVGHSFKTMKVKRMNIDFVVNEISDNFRGNMAVSRDSLIVISVIPLFGYEVLRIMCTKDSIIVINRTDKTYHASSLDYYMNKYNIPAGFKDLQAVLTNEAFFYMMDYKDRIYEKEIKLEGKRILYSIKSFMGSIKLTNQQIVADSAYYNIKDIFVADYQRDVRLAIKYDDFNSYEKEYFPNKISVEIQDRNNSINLVMEYGLVIFDEKINVMFVVPDNYSRIYM